MISSAKKATRKIEILLIEDNPGDARLTEEVLRESGAHCKLSTIRDPEQALAQLRGEAPNVPRIIPEIIFLDLNLPKVSGLEIIEKIRSTDGLNHVPIVILSSTENPDDIRRAYRLGGNCFVRKPIELDQFIHFLTTCYEFWCNVVVLPPIER